MPHYYCYKIQNLYVVHGGIPKKIKNIFWIITIDTIFFLLNHIHTSFVCLLIILIIINIKFILLFLLYLINVNSKKIK